MRKGQGPKPVYAPAPERAKMIEHHSFLSGWWGEQRSLILPEVDNLLFSFRGVLLAKMMFMVFEKLTKDSDVKKLVGRAKKGAAKRLETFQNLGASEGLPVPTDLRKRHFRRDGISLLQSADSL